MLVKDLHWQESVDIVVVGLGAAGAIAAITARDLGAEVELCIGKEWEKHMITTSTAERNACGLTINVLQL